MTLAELIAGGPVIIDGGLSTQLEAMGRDVHDPLWTARALIDAPEVVTAAHRAFVEAGAQIVITASYQVSREGFIAVGRSADDADAALRASIAAARAAGPQVVAASVGPYGAITHDGAEYRGRYGRSVDELAAFHAERIAVLIDAGPDLLAIETIPDADEVRAIVEVLASVPDVPAWLSVTAADASTLWSGDAITEAIGLVADAPSIQAVGVNCTAPEHVVGALMSIASATDLPLLAYPNAGGVWDAASGSWVGVTPDTLTARAREWREAGAVLIGGCCGTDAAAIAQIAQAVSTR